MFESGPGHINDANLNTDTAKGKRGKGAAAKKGSSKPDAEETAKGTGVAGRKDGGTEAAVEVSQLKKRAKELEQLYMKRKDAAEAYNIGRKAVAEASGLMSSVVDKFIKARVDQKFAAKQREYEQLSLVFSELGE